MHEKMNAEKEVHKEVVCNVCGQPIKKLSFNKTEDYLCIQKQWSYFSAKDLTIHSFVVCETCYDKWIQSFAIPIEEKQVIEIFDFAE